MTKVSSLCLASIAMLMPTFGIAHSMAGADIGWWSGIAHPFAGVDHLLAIVAVGVWAVQRGAAAIWQLPGVFVVALVGGAGCALAAVPVPGIEPGIVASVLVLGAVIAANPRLTTGAGALLVAAAGWVHGYAHGAEIPPATDRWAYAVGLVLATALLQAGVIAMAVWLRRPQMLRGLGMVLLATGVAWSLG